MPHALELRDLCFGYGRRQVVRDVSLSLRAGDCCGFVGHNGAGKTTVLRLCLLLLTPRRGSVHIFGVDAQRAGPQARAAVGALVERPGFFRQATALQNLTWLARLQGLPRRAAMRDGERALELLGLTSAARRRVGTFSLGMRQRLGIAQALLGQPRLLLLDEPASGLDPEGIAELRALLRHLSRDERVAVLLSSHQLQELEGLCSHIGVLRDGAMVVAGELETLRRGLHARHTIAGSPLPVLAKHLTALGLHPEFAGETLLVDLQGRAPGSIARELTAVAELTRFGPEPVTLETIYLQATALGGLEPPAPPASAPASVCSSATSTAASTAPPTEPATDAAARPLWRAFAHEWRTLLRPTTSLLLLAPCAVGAYCVFAYQRQVTGGLARVRAGELFSADAGSGQIAFAQALQAATPVLAAILLWFGSQAVAADLARDTLRNTLVRSVGRPDVLLGKFGALALASLAGFAALVLSTLGIAGMLLGLGDLVELSRHGDAEVLAHAVDVTPVMWRAIAHCMLPLLAVAATALLASTLARRPARALALALLVLLGPELLRGRWRDGAGWLLTSHLPIGWRDDSGLAYFAAFARGAADASWNEASLALLAPLTWLATALVLALLVLRRLRVP